MIESSFAYLAGALTLARQSIKSNTIGMVLAKRMADHADLALTNGNKRTALEMILMSLTYSVGLHHPYYEDVFNEYNRVAWEGKLVAVK